MSNPPNIPVEPQVVAPKPDWMQRNWKWALPVGCLGIFAIGVAGVAGLVIVIFASIKSSDAYTGALQRAQSDPAVIQALGEPIEAGFLVGGSINVSGPSGEADLMIPIQGPNGAGTLYATATKQAGQWTYQVLQVELAADGTRIDLLPDAPTEY